MEGAQGLAISAGSLARWTGGIDFLRFCVSALDSVAPDTSWKILLPRETATQAAMKSLKGAVKKVAGIKNSAPTVVAKAALVDALKGYGTSISVVEFSDSHKGLTAAMTQARAQSLFPCTHSLGIRFPFGWIGYIPDLQHKRLPQWFSSRDSKARDRLFARLLTDAPAVVVNSAAVVRDIEEFFPNHRARLFSLPFCPPANVLSVPDKKKASIRNMYGLPQNYFMISNQFWVHKDHETAFRALSLVRESGHDIHLVCTGNVSDYRWPQHFSELMRLIEEKGLQKYIHILGLIPKCDQLEMMRSAIAVVQPTLFEGGPGGGSVYDAISLNVPSIASDIPVNREIDIGVVRFFAPGSAEDLAVKMIEFVENPPEMPAEVDTFAKLRQRQKEYGKFLLNISASVVNGTLT
jgi:glycosyltransferase involved in cell wall biosynthesis